MLHLQSETSAQWVDLAVDNIDTILIDHAHCEKKAASTAINLIFRYPHRTELLRPLSEVAREELEHFELVLDYIEGRGQTFQRLSPSPYAGKLLTIMRPNEPDRLIDMLLCCAMIEARSCERMGLLADGLVGKHPDLARFYAGLLKSEARHHMLYVRLAHNYADENEIKKRLKSIALHEAEIISAAQFVPRMHN
jgi:tRNA-(ms[2]io[6]A)-hydroxylase